MTNKYLGVITGKQFQDQYNDMEQKGMNPRASTVLPIKAEDNNETTALFHVWIFHDKAVPPKKTILEL